jgi:hypothetical protein
VDADLYARWEKHNREWWSQYLDEQEARNRRQQWRKRHRWLVRIGSGLGIGAMMGLTVMAGALWGWILGDTVACRPRQVDVVIKQDHS